VIQLVRVDSAHLRAFFLCLLGAESGLPLFIFDRLICCFHWRLPNLLRRVLSLNHNPSIACRRSQRMIAALVSHHYDSVCSSIYAPQ
jgi:hypothetical protein